MTDNAKEQYYLVQIDVDSFSTLTNYYGNKNYDSSKDRLYEIAVPRLLDIFDKYNTKATFFISGKDFVNNENACSWIVKIKQKGHEIANHSFSHPTRLSARPESMIEEEIEKNHRAIKDFFGISCVGYRSPGYSINKNIMRLLTKKGYLYDSSVFPTSISFLYKLYRNMTAYFKKDTSPTCMGSFFLFLVPREPYLVHFADFRDHGTGHITEIPVTTTKIGRLPFYFSFHLCLPEILFGMMLKNIKANYINYLFHGADVLDYENDNLNDPYIAKHPTIKIPIGLKMKRVEAAMQSLSGRTNILSCDLAKRMLKEADKQGKGG